MEISHSERGFLQTDEFVDSRENHITVTESSAASDHYAWVWIKNTGEIGGAFKGEMSLHLNKKHAKELISRLVVILGKEILEVTE